MVTSISDLKNLTKKALIDKILDLEKRLERQMPTKVPKTNDNTAPSECINQTLSAQENSAKMALLGEMSGDMAHEINNPLLVLSGYISKLKDYMEESSLPRDKMAKAVERVDSMTNRIQDIVKGLLRFSRSDNNGLEFKVETLHQIIDDTIVLCDHKLKGANIKLIIDDYPEDLDLECAKLQVSQVLLNLLKNSYDAIEKTPSPWIKIEINELGSHIKIQLTDSGSGIPMESQKKLFERGFSTKGIGLGTGLGLALSKGLIEAQSGSLTIDPTCENTRFVITLPKRQDKKAS